MLFRSVPETAPGTEAGPLAVALNRMLGQIEQAFTDRTEADARLRRFVADASHELRTPLTSLGMAIELLRRDHPTNIGATTAGSDAAVAQLSLLDTAQEDVARLQDVAQRLLLRKGNLGEVTLGSLGFSAELRGLAHVLNQPKGRIFQYGCDAVLGDGRCKINLNGAAFRADCAAA